MRRTVFLLAIGLLSPQLVTSSTALAVTASRINFLAADTGYLYWSPDASDPELTEPSVTRTCGIPPTYSTPDAAPCLTGIEATTGFFTHTLFFTPAALLDEPLAWLPPDLPRFRIAVSSALAIPSTVHLVIQNGTAQLESSAAVEVSPGVFEGVMPESTPLDRTKTLQFGVRVRTRASRFGFTVTTGGASFIDFAAPVAMRSVPELLAAVPAASGSLETPQRRFDLNDGEHSLHRFPGDLVTTRRFSIQLETPTPVVYAWVESFVDPFIADTVRSGEPDVRRLRDTPVISLFHNGERITGGANSAGIKGRGMDTVAAVGLGSGLLTLEVGPSTSSVGGSYVAYILTAGERTISRIRWQASPVDNEPYVTNRMPGLAICPAAGEVIPVTSSVTTFNLDVDWETVNPMPGERWTLRYTLPDVGTYGCGEAGMGDHVRFTMPQRSRVWWVGAVPPRDTMMISLRMTTFTYDVRLAYD